MKIAMESEPQISSYPLQQAKAISNIKVYIEHMLKDVEQVKK